MENCPGESGRPRSHNSFAGGHQTTPGSCRRPRPRIRLSNSPAWRQRKRHRPYSLRRGGAVTFPASSGAFLSPSGQGARGSRPPAKCRGNGAPQGAHLKSALARRGRVLRSTRTPRGAPLRRFLFPGPRFQALAPSFLGLRCAGSTPCPTVGFRTLRAVLSSEHLAEGS